jgi:hypothetical protein
MEYLEKRETPFKPVEGHQGLYRHPGITFPIYLIVCNELPVERVYYPLLIFSSGTKLQEYFKQIGLDADFDIYIKYIVAAHPVEGYELNIRRSSKVTTAERKKVARILADGMSDEEIAEMLKVKLDNQYPEAQAEFIANVQKYLGPKRFAKIQAAIEPELSVEDYAETAIQRFEPQQLEVLIASLQKQLGKANNN